MSVGLMITTHNKIGQELVATAVKSAKRGIMRGQ